MGKYIIDCDEQSNVYRTYQDSLGRMFIQLVPKGGGMLPYTEPDTEQVKEEAFDAGYKRAGEDARKLYKGVKEKAYQNGLDDAWETARKIAQTDAGKHYAIFGIYPSCDIFKQYTASEAIDRIRQYEEKEEKDFGEVRDVLEETVKACNVTLDEIAEVLRKMKGEE